MKKRHYPKRVIPKTMITRFQEIFKPVSLKVKNVVSSQHGILKIAYSVPP